MSRLDQIEQMLQKEPDDRFLNFALAMEMVKATRYDDAIAQFKRVNTLDPNYIPGWFQQGSTLVTMGRLDDAGAILRHGITVANQIGDAHAAGEMSELLASLT